MKKLFKNLIFSIIAGVSFLLPLGNNNNVSQAIENKQFIQERKEAQSFSDTISSYTLEDALTSRIRFVATTSTSASIAVTIELPSDYEDRGYFVGYGDSAENYVAATVGYQVKKEDGTTEDRYSELNKDNSLLNYIGIGQLGTSTVSTTADVDLSDGEKILSDSFYIFNVIKAVKNSENRWVPEEDGGNKVWRYMVCDIPTSFTERKLSDFVTSIKYDGMAKFAQYGCIAFTVNSDISKYPSLSTSIKRVYNNYEEDIKNGDAYVRIKLGFTANTILKAYFKGSDEPVEVRSSTQNVNIADENSRLEFLYTEFNRLGELEDFEIYNFTLNFDILSITQSRIVPNSGANIRFSSLKLGVKTVKSSSGTVLVEGNDHPYNINAGLIYLISIISFVAVYLGIATFMYFYLKKKNANDEFKRMNTKSYLQTNAFGLICLTSILVCVEAVIFRVGVFNGSFTVHNILDAFIVVGFVIGLIFTLYFVRYFYLVFKNIRDRKRNDKLRMSKNNVDDGTLIRPSTDK